MRTSHEHRCANKEKKADSGASHVVVSKKKSEEDNK